MHDHVHSFLSAPLSGIDDSPVVRRGRLGLSDYNSTSLCPGIRSEPTQGLHSARGGLLPVRGSEPQVGYKWVVDWVENAAK